MKKIKIIREIEPKIKSVKEISTKEKPDSERRSSPQEFVDDSPISKSRSSPTLEAINQSESVEEQTKFFQRDEREERERETRFYESVQGRGNRLEYTPSEIVGAVGVASARSSEDLLDRNNLLNSSSRQNFTEGIPQSQAPEKNYELKDDNSMRIKRRKELY